MVESFRLSGQYRWIHNVASQATVLGITVEYYLLLRASCRCGSLARISFRVQSRAPIP